MSPFPFQESALMTFEGDPKQGTVDIAAKLQVNELLYVATWLIYTAFNATFYNLQKLKIQKGDTTKKC